MFPFRTLRAAAFLVKAPFIVAMLFVINLVTSPGLWWVQWPAMGLAIAWVFSLLRVIRGVILAGGLAALGLYLAKHMGITQTAQKS